MDKSPAVIVQVNTFFTTLLEKRTTTIDRFFKEVLNYLVLKNVS